MVQSLYSLQSTFRLKLKKKGEIINGLSKYLHKKVYFPSPIYHYRLTSRHLPSLKYQFIYTENSHFDLYLLWTKENLILSSTA